VNKVVVRVELADSNFVVRAVGQSWDVRATNCTLAESVDQAARMVRSARAQKMPVRVLIKAPEFIRLRFKSMLEAVT
jgi:hypothetical protein